MPVGIVARGATPPAEPGAEEGGLLFSAEEGVDVLGRFVGDRGFDHPGDLVGRHAAVEHFSLELGFDPPLVDLRDGGRGDAGERDDDAGEAAEGDDDQRKTLIRVETEKLIGPRVGRGFRNLRQEEVDWQVVHVSTPEISQTTRRL